MKPRVPPKNKHNSLLSSFINERTPAEKKLLSPSTDFPTRFRLYAKNFKSNTLESIKKHAWTDNEKSAMQACYAKGKSLEKLSAAIYKAQAGPLANICPYCCINVPHERDHYMPKGNFPEFSVHALNIVPSCGRCNKIKSQKWLDKNKKRRILNFYTDSLPEIKYLYAHLRWKKTSSGMIPTAEFKLKKPKNLDAEIFSSIERHFTELHLIDYYRSNTHLGITWILNSVRHLKDRPKSEIHECLKRINESNAASFGINYWTVTLGSALLEEGSFHLHL